MLILVAWLGGVVTPVISVYQLQAVVSQCLFLEFALHVNYQYKWC